ncbi:hypothetical protein BN1002_00220 [Bacillus sp. B-jedd]|nr:hypothetical protein BN1002_00220 [Bacillus sp. B-jedd]
MGIFRFCVAAFAMPTCLLPIHRHASAVGACYTIGEVDRLELEEFHNFWNVGCMGSFKGFGHLSEVFFGKKFCSIAF